MKNVVKCRKCLDQKYITLNCCSGYQCGCMGQPVQLKNCSNCNADGKEEMGVELASHDSIKCLEYTGV